MLKVFQVPYFLMARTLSIFLQIYYALINDIPRGFKRENDPLLGFL